MLTHLLLAFKVILPQINNPFRDGASVRLVEKSDARGEGRGMFTHLLLASRHLTAHHPFRDGAPLLLVEKPDVGGGGTNWLLALRHFTTDQQSLWRKG